MSRCDCNCDPCKCRRKKPCNPCDPITSNTTTLPQCDVVNECVREDLQKTLADFGDPVIDNICAVSRKCVNDGFESIIEGSSSGMSNFAGAVFAALKTLPWYSGNGTKQLTIVNGVMQWLGSGASTTTSTTTTMDPNQPTTTTTVADRVYYGSKVSSTPPTVLEILSSQSYFTDGANNVQIDWRPFNVSPQYLWFAIPARTTNHNKNYYYFTQINQGNIGGGLNLFGSPETITINGLSYYLWISNYATQTTEVALLSKI